MVSPNRYVKKTPLPASPRSAILLGNSRGKGTIFKLDSNEAVIPPSPKVLTAIQKFLKQKNNFNFYPNPFAPELRKEIARYVRLTPEHIFPTGGSEQALEFLCTAYLQEGDIVAVPVPTFPPFMRWALANGAKIQKIPYGFPSKFDPSLIAKRAGARARIIYLVNPYLTTLAVADIAKIARAHPRSLVIVDEAYQEYGGASAARLIPKYSNLAITRTFSKTFMLAGLRLGYLLGNPTVILNTRKVAGLYNINSLAYVAGIAALRDVSHTKKYVRDVRKAMRLLASELPKLGFETIQTQAGFLLFKHKNIGSKRVQALLERERVFVRYPSFDEFPHHLRMNVGTVAFTKTLLKRFERQFSEE